MDCVIKGYSFNADCISVNKGTTCRRNVMCAGITAYVASF